MLGLQGGTIPLALAATQPAYATKVLASVTSLGPIAYLGNTPSPVLRQWANGITPDEVRADPRLTPVFTCRLRLVT